MLTGYRCFFILPGYFRVTKLNAKKPAGRGPLRVFGSVYRPKPGLSRLLKADFHPTGFCIAAGSGHLFRFFEFNLGFSHTGCRQGITHHQRTLLGQFGILCRVAGRIVKT